MKKYFLKDATLQSIDDDQFRYQDFANNLWKILECNKTPFNISEYQLMDALPEELKETLPSVEDIESRVMNNYKCE